MFSGRLATDVLEPSSRWAGVVRFSASRGCCASRSGHPSVFNAAFASLQLAIGIGLLMRRAVVPALLASIVWALAVWYLGEGLGGLTGSNAALLTGAPGPRCCTRCWLLALGLLQPRVTATPSQPLGSASLGRVLGRRGDLAATARAAYWAGLGRDGCGGCQRCPWLAQSRRLLRRAKRRARRCRCPRRFRRAPSSRRARRVCACAFTSTRCGRRGIRLQRVLDRRRWTKPTV